MLAASAFQASCRGERLGKAIIVRHVAVGLAFGLLAPFTSAQTPDIDLSELGRLVSQPDYEVFMTCLGNHAGGLDVLARIIPSAKEPEAVRNIEQQGREILADLQATAAELKDTRVKLDHRAGVAAFTEGRRKFDDAKDDAIGDQYALYRNQGGFNDECRETLERVVSLSSVQAQLFAVQDGTPADE